MKYEHLSQQEANKAETKKVWKGSDNTKGKWPPKEARPREAGEKENVVSYKKFSAIEKRHELKPIQQQNKGDGRRQLQFWICGNEQGRLFIVPRWQASNLQCSGSENSWDVEHNIPHIYATLHNKQVDRQESIKEMDDKLCDQAMSILIKLESKYSYVNHVLMDKWGLRK